MCENGSTESTSLPRSETVETHIQRRTARRTRCCRAKASRLWDCRSCRRCRSERPSRRDERRFVRRPAVGPARADRRTARFEGRQPVAAGRSNTTACGTATPLARNTIERLTRNRRRAASRRNVAGCMRVVERLRRINRYRRRSLRKAWRSRTTIQSTQLCAIKATRSPCCEPGVADRAGDVFDAFEQLRD